MNRIVKSAMAIAAVTAMSLGALAGCGGSDASDSGKGKVYFLNFKPEAADQWKDLASAYTKETGVQMTVETAASGTYEQQLKSEMAKSEAPTLFQINGPVGYANWKEYTADLKDTEIYKQLQNQDVALKDGDKVVGVPYAMETYGLIYNKDILKKYFALSGAKAKSVKDIDSFDTLKAVANDMQARKDDLGIKGAFTSAGFDSSSDWRFKTHLANIPLYYELKKDNVTEQPATIKGTYMPQFKNIFDLYLKDSTTAPTQLSSKTGDDANSEFALGEAAFYQNGTWAWSDLQKAGMEPGQVGMMPDLHRRAGREERRSGHRVRELLVRQRQGLQGGPAGHQGLPQVGHHIGCRQGCAGQADGLHDAVQDLRGHQGGQSVGSGRRRRSEVRQDPGQLELHDDAVRAVEERLGQCDA
jgi:raffinose/stachyose/melibiose transport system substrate-binding protein